MHNLTVKELKQRFDNVATITQPPVHLVRPVQHTLLQTQQTDQKQIKKKISPKFKIISSTLPIVMSSSKSTGASIFKELQPISKSLSMVTTEQEIQNGPYRKSKHKFGVIGGTKEDLNILMDNVWTEDTTSDIHNRTVGRLSKINVRYHFKSTYVDQEKKAT